MDRDEIRKRYQVTAEEAFVLERAIVAIKQREERKQVLMAEAEGYRALSNFVLNPQHPDVRDAPPSEAVLEFLGKSDADIRANDLNQGMAYTAPKKVEMSTREAVLDYMSGFGWHGLGSRQIAAAVKRSKRGVDGVLAELVDECLIAVRETNTRGKSASRRKVYFALDNRPLVEEGDANPDVTTHDTYFEDTDDAHDAEGHGAGGGRVIRPRGGAE